MILAKTVKGWTLGSDIEARNATHQIKKMTTDQLTTLRDRLHLDIADSAFVDGIAPYFHPGTQSPEYEYLMERRRALHGFLPERVERSKIVIFPADSMIDQLAAGTGPKVQASTTTAFTRLLKQLMKEPEWGHRVVPIIPDEGRTFGMDSLFNDSKIYASHGQQYEPVDSGLLLSYREAIDGRILEEGITEAGAMGSFTAAGTAYATWSQPMIPFFVFYSMFGFQRIGDLVWAFGDQRGKGFLMGATAGRTTLSGEGLQHCDGHSHVLASTVPNCRAYDPAFAFEVAVIVRDGIRAMYGPEPQDCFYYITLYNENYLMPAMPAIDGIEAGIVKGVYCYQPATEPRAHRAQLLGSGPMVRTALEAQAILAADFDVAADVWSVTSYKSLREEALECERWNRLHPFEPPRTPYVTQTFADADGPVIAVTDFQKAVPDQIARFMPQPFVPLGTDGFGASDTRESLRRYFEIDAAHIVVATLDGLSQLGLVTADVVDAAIKRFEIAPETPDPRRR